jgi:hypothetical protein
VLVILRSIYHANIKIEHIYHSIIGQLKKRFITKQH